MDFDKDTKPHIRLPFESEKFEIGEWVYAHRLGLFATIILYLALAISAITAKITIEIQHHSKGIAIDIEQLIELEKQRDELQKSVEELQKQTPQDWSEVQNVASNESLEQNSELTSNSEIQDMINEAMASQQRMADNRAAYEKGLAEIQEYREQNSGRDSHKESESHNNDSNVEGNVTVSYSFIDPVRHARRLRIPAYTCEGGGEVSIQVMVNQIGEVVSAKVYSGGDECMQQAALSSARESLFDINKTAPSRQMGIIIYLFIPQ